MIIKSLGRKASGKLTGGGKGKSPFTVLTNYMARGVEQGDGREVLWHGFYGQEGMDRAEIIQAFENNARHLKERKNGNILYHEILSFSTGHTLSDEELARVIADIGQEYLRLRAPNQLGYGVAHLDTEHIHLHLMISANEIGKRQRVRLSKEDFSKVQKELEAFVLTRYQSLEQTKIYDLDRPKERLKTQVHEQAMRARTGEHSRKEALKQAMHQSFARAQNTAELQKMLLAQGIEFYTRGTTTGILVRDADGTERKHRLSTLGLAVHYQETTERLAAIDKNVKTQDNSTRDAQEKVYTDAIIGNREQSASSKEPKEEPRQERRKTKDDDRER